jgi:hypothetical protein
MALTHTNFTRGLLKMEIGITNIPVELEYPSAGPVSASASADGQLVCIDFANPQWEAALRLAFPASALQNAIDALLYVQKLLGDQTSGLHLQKKH